MMSIFIFIFHSILFYFLDLEFKVSMISQTVIQHGITHLSHITQNIIEGSRTMISSYMLIIYNTHSL